MLMLASCRSTVAPSSRTRAKRIQAMGCGLVDVELARRARPPRLNHDVDGLVVRRDEMGIVDRLLGRRNPSDEKAKSLVETARIFAITTFEPVDKEFHLKVETAEQLQAWDTLMTVGGVAVALYSLRDRAPSDRFVQLVVRICKELDGWNKIGSKALEDCRGFIERSSQGKKGESVDVSREDALGVWVLWNLYGRCPTHEESKPARAIGGMLGHTFSAWWDA